MSDLTILMLEPEVVLLGRKKVKLYAVRLKDFELFGKSALAVMGVSGMTAFLKLVPAWAWTALGGLVLHERTPTGADASSLGSIRR